MQTLEDRHPWTVDDSANLYAVNQWSNGYFSVSAKGEAQVNLHDTEGRKVPVSMPDILSGLGERGIPTPVLLRFGELLTSRIKLIHESWHKAMKEEDYEGEFRGVYPIKVNQQQQAVEELTKFGRRYHYGLEAGSKAEFIAA